MKHVRFIALMVGLLGFASSCSDSTNLDKPLKEASLGTSVETQKGGKVTFNNSNDTGVDVQVLSISDSRCPVDAVCVWEGNAKVGFQVGTLKNIIYLCLLKNLPDCSQETEVSYEGKSYVLTLLDVTPIPTTSNGDAEKTAKFQLKLK